MLSTVFLYSDCSGPIITHAEVSIIPWPPKSSNSSQLVDLQLECFALSPTLKEGDLVLDAQHQVNKSENSPLISELLSTDKPTNNGKQMVSYLSVRINTEYRVSIRRKEDLRQDGHTRPIMTLKFKYDPHVLVGLTVYDKNPSLSVYPLRKSCWCRTPES